MKKKIIFFTGSLSHGGAERVISILTKHLIEKGYNIELVLFYDREIFYDIHPNIKLTFIQRENHTTNKIKNLLWLRKKFKEKNSLIISFLAPMNIYALLAHLGLRNKIIVADRNDPRQIPSNVFIRWFRNIIYTFADGIVCQTEHNLKYFSKRIQKKGIVIYNPVDMDDKQGLALKTEKKDKIVMVGRLTEQKNHRLAIEAFKIISKKFPDYKMFFYGDGELKESLEKDVSSLSLSDRIIFCGNSKDIFVDEADAKLFLLTSDFEGMPNALLEAMCLGLPVISTEVSGATDLIENGINGVLVPDRKPKTIAMEMQKVLASPNYQKQLGENASELNKLLEIKNIMNQWLDFIFSIY